MLISGKATLMTADSVRVLPSVRAGGGGNQMVQGLTGFRLASNEGSIAKIRVRHRCHFSVPLWPQFK